MTIDEKRDILEAAGYQFNDHEGCWHVQVIVMTPDGWVFDPIEYGGDTEQELQAMKAELLTNAVNKAWQHYQTKKDGNDDNHISRIG